MKGLFLITALVMLAAFMGLSAREETAPMRYLLLGAITVLTGVFLLT